MSNRDSAINDLLISGSDDWVLDREVELAARAFLGATDDTIVEISLELVRAVLDQGLMEVGEIGENVFVRWNLSSEETVGRIRSAWNDPNRQAYPGELFWLANTESGNLRASAVSERERAIGEATQARLAEQLSPDRENRRDRSLNNRVLD